jgi:RNA polymerase I-specific transcription initiation factor RRN7
MNKLVESIDSQHSQTFSTVAAEANISVTEQTRGRGVKLKNLPSLLESIGLCYLGIYLLRLPIFIGDLRRWIAAGEMPYLNPREELPRDMQIRLGPGQIYLRKMLVPSEWEIRNAVYSVFAAYEIELGMSLPPLNLSLCLYRMIEELKVPPETYPTVKRLVGILKCDFSLPKGLNWGSVFQSRTPNQPPERLLAGLFVVTVKLLYPFDMVPLRPYTSNDPTVTVVDWNLWKELREESAQRQRVEKQGLSYHDIMTVTEKDIVSMEDEEIDKYMDWFADSMAKPREAALGGKNQLANEMFKLFPIDKSQDTSIHKPPSSDTDEEFAHDAQSNVERIQNGLIIRDVVTEEDEEALNTLRREEVLRPGKRYTRYRSADEFEDNGISRLFYTDVAELIGLTVEELMWTVIQLEARLMNAMQKERTATAQQRKKRPDQMDMD